MIQTYQITVLDREYNQNCVFALPFLPRVGDNVVLDDIAVTILNLTIHANRIMVTNHSQNNKIVTMNNPNPGATTEDELIIPIVALCDIQQFDKKEENQSHE